MKWIKSNHVMCAHLHSVGQGCIQHREDSQVSAEVRHHTTAHILRTQNRQHVHTVAAHKNTESTSD